MSASLTKSPTLTYWHMVWDPRTHCHGENRTVTVSLDLPHEILMRLVCSDRLGAKVAAYFASLAASQLTDVAGYLRGFLSRILADCRLDSMELAVREEKRGGEFDFPRPSPSRVLIHDFCMLLTRDVALYESLKCPEFRILGLKHYDDAA